MQKPRLSDRILYWTFASGFSYEGALVRETYQVRRYWARTVTGIGGGVLGFIGFTFLIHGVTLNDAGRRFAGILGLALGLFIMLLGALTVFLGIQAYFRWVELQCPTCNNQLPKEKNWVCGCCDQVNRNRTLLDQCEHCGATPKSYRCPTCDGLIFLNWFNVEGDEAFAAPEPEQSRKRHSHEIEKIMRDRELNNAMSALAESQSQRQRAEAQVRPSSANKAGNGSKPKSDYDKAYEEAKRLLLQKIGSHQAANDVEAEFRRRYANDPRMLDVLEDAFQSVHEDMSLR